VALDAPVAIHLCGPPEGARITPGGRAAHALCSTLLQVGFTEPPESPLALVRSYRTVSALPVARGPIGGLSLLHCPSGRPDLALASTLPDGVPTFLDVETPRPPGRLTIAFYATGLDSPIQQDMYS
jgi:hypothetical protein